MGKKRDDSGDILFLGANGPDFENLRSYLTRHGYGTTNIGPDGRIERRSPRTDLIPGTPRFFIASTYRDLKEFRTIAERVVNSIGLMPEDVGHLESKDPDDIAALCRSILRTCHACILLIGNQRGSGPQDNQKGKMNSPSYTMIEFREARRAQMPVLTFFISCSGGYNDRKSSSVKTDGQVSEFKREIETWTKKAVSSGRPGTSLSRIRRIHLREQLEYFLELDLKTVTEQSSLLEPGLRESVLPHPSSMEDIFGPVFGKLIDEFQQSAERSSQALNETLSLLNGYPADTETHSFSKADRHNDRGWDFHVAGHYRKAVSEYKAALRLVPEFPMVWNNLGLSFYRLNDFLRSEECYLEAIRISPGFIKPWSNLGILHWALKRDKYAATKWLKRALALNPGYHRALKLLQEINSS